MAMEGTGPPLHPVFPSTHDIITLEHSRRCSSRTRHKTPQRPNARRVPSSEQDSLPPKPARKRHQRPARCLILTVSPLPHFLFHLFCVQLLICMGCVDIPTWTKSASFLQSATSLSWSSPTKGVRARRRMRCIITSWMVKTKSRRVFLSYFHPADSETNVLVFADYVRQEVEGHIHCCRFLSPYAIHSVLFVYPQSCSTFGFFGRIISSAVCH